MIKTIKMNAKRMRMFADNVMLVIVIGLMNNFEDEYNDLIFIELYLN